jgi:hypothetical protein
MANKAVSLFMDTKVEGKWTSVPAREKGLRSLKAGVYRLRWYEGGKARYENVGREADKALAALSRKRKELDARAAGIAIVVTSNSRTRLDDAKKKYLDGIKLLVGNDGYGRSERSHKAYSYRLGLFEKFINREQSKPKVEYIEQVEDERVLRPFVVWLREEKYSDRTVVNIVRSLHSFLKANGNTAAKWLATNLSYAEELPRVYSLEEEQKYFAACNEYESIWSGFFRWSGGREREVMHAQPRDITERSGVTHVHFYSKPELGFRLKSRKTAKLSATVSSHCIPVMRRSSSTTCEDENCTVSCSPTLRGIWRATL